MKKSKYTVHNFGRHMDGMYKIVIPVWINTSLLFCLRSYFKQLIPFTYSPSLRFYRSNTYIKYYLNILKHPSQMSSTFKRIHTHIFTPERSHSRHFFPTKLKYFLVHQTYNSCIFRYQGICDERENAMLYVFCSSVFEFLCKHWIHFQCISENVQTNATNR